MANPFSASTPKPTFERPALRTRLAFETTSARPENRVVSTLGTYSGGGKDVGIETSDRLAALRLRSDVRTAAFRHALSPESALLLNAVAESYSTTGEPANFLRHEAARKLQLTVEQVDAVMHSLT